jgi:MFS family permease
MKCPPMREVLQLLSRNRNYRYLWLGQVVSEIGDYFNNVAVYALVMEKTGSGMVISGVMLARAIPAMLAGPVAGVALDRMDRRRIMIASDLVRCVVALGFMATAHQPRPWLLYVLSGLLMFASPFFTSGRAAILPSIVSPEELHTANSLTQTTQWATLTLGALMAGWTASLFGYRWALGINSLSFLFSAWAVWQMAGAGGGFRARRQALNETRVVRPWHEYREGLAYMRSTPLMVGIAMISVGWAMGGGAAQVLFALFGEQVFHRGASGIGAIWGFAGVGLLLGGAAGHVVGKRVDYAGYKRAVTLSYLLHGAAYMMFSQAAGYPAALLWMLLSRVGMAVTSVLNQAQLLVLTEDEYRGRVFSTLESLRWSVMIVSMGAAGIASRHWDPRTIGLVAGAFGLVTALGWAWADWTGRLPQPLRRRPAPSVEIHDATA